MASYLYSVEELRGFDAIMAYQRSSQRAIDYYFGELVHRRFSDPAYMGYTGAELRAAWRALVGQLRESTCLELIVECEARLRLDYYSKAKGKPTNDLCRTFRDLYQRRQLKVNLEQDIIEAWKKLGPGPPHHFSDFKGAMKYRHWMAHGRYFKETFGRTYDVDDVYVIVTRVGQALSTLV